MLGAEPSDPSAAAPDAGSRSSVAAEIRQRLQKVRELQQAMRRASRSEAAPTLQPSQPAAEQRALPAGEVSWAASQQPASPSAATAVGRARTQSADDLGDLLGESDPMSMPEAGLVARLSAVSVPPNAPPPPSPAAIGPPEPRWGDAEGRGLGASAAAGPARADSTQAQRLPPALPVQAASRNGRWLPPHEERAAASQRIPPAAAPLPHQQERSASTVPSPRGSDTGGHTLHSPLQQGSPYQSHDCCNSAPPPPQPPHPQLRRELAEERERHRVTQCELQRRSDEVVALLRLHSELQMETVTAVRAAYAAGAAAAQLRLPPAVAP
eukprot:TRINITY_DN11205_c0_g1_i3.p1 TRINITY_DN11205_c0_g1~~TRINITY_DN11205_c0_g1_i3.p1  ORF type:complete len:325 (+),score=75.93 TRINITY_DN11205_c0_g1_i3:66-1040(+)